ncbi:MAG: hypothetical protein NTX24_04685 [Candidatus Pacearchaeota archaeon]|nr:hypothetical protein [Candidatus Pacearchaeota archaeon]
MKSNLSNKKKSLGKLIFAVSLLFIFSFLLSGSRSSATPYGCCENLSGAICIESLESACVPGPFSPTSCDNIANCKKGCCVTDDGCSYNTPKKLCNGEFLNDAMCTATNCQKVCCIYPGLNNGWDITSKIGCEKGAESHGFIPEIFYTSDPDVCQDFFNSGEKGCCVIDREDKCSYTTRESCNSNDGQFHLGKFCSNVTEGGCSSKCSEHFRKGCGDNSSKVYWFDSCGNQEDEYMQCSDGYACSQKGNDASCKFASCLYDDSRNSGKQIQYNLSDSWCGYDYNISKVLYEEEKPGVGWSDFSYVCGPNNIVEIFPLKSDGSTMCVMDGKRATEIPNIITEDCTKLTDKLSCTTNPLCMWIDNFTEFRVLQAEKDFLYPSYDKNAEWNWLTDIRGFANNVCLPRFPLNSEDGSGQDCSVGTIEYGSAVKDRLATYSETGWGWDAWHCLEGEHSRCYLGGSMWTSSVESELTYSYRFGAEAPLIWGLNSDPDSISSIFFEGNSHITSNSDTGCEPADNSKGSANNPGCINSLDREAIWSTAMAKRCRQLGSCGAYDTWAGTRSSVGARLKKDQRETAGSGFPGKLIGVEFFNDPELNSPYINAHDPNAGTAARVSLYSFYCDSWVRPAGGADCHLCNEDPFRPCNQPRCEALGQGCVFDEIAECTYGTVNDPIPPYVIECTKDIIDGQGNVRIRDLPCEDGVDVENFERIVINLTMSEDAQCAYTDDGTSPDLTDPQYWLADNRYTKEHIKTLSYAPIENDVHEVLTYSCQDKAIPTNRMQPDQEIRFTIKKFEMGSNRFPPFLNATSPDNASYLSMGIGESNLTFYVYLDENATCRWSAPGDLPYESMTNEFIVNETTGGPDEVLYYGYTNLTLKGEMANIFYLKCNDSAGNVNPVSYVIIFYPSTLLIDSVEPVSGLTIEACADNVNDNITVNVTTSGGSDEGAATCYWKSDLSTRWKEFDETGSNTHLTKVQVSVGENHVNVSCEDSTGSKVWNSTAFNVKEDNSAPEIIRFYQQGGELVIKTNGNALCSFNKNTNSCKFNATDIRRAEPFGTSDGLEHVTSWRDKPWYVKCYDTCGNGAAPDDDCTVIVPQNLG